ncbi:hypothetical protein ACOME3_003242 [Neoechinorhynchus agilis]
MSHKGIPHESRAARIVVKMYTAGRIPYSYPPPGIIDSNRVQQSNDELYERQKFEKKVDEAFNQQFFERYRSQEDNKRQQYVGGKKHFKANRHVKLRKRYAHLDRH